MGAGVKVLGVEFRLQSYFYTHSGHLRLYWFRNLGIHPTLGTPGSAIYQGAMRGILSCLACPV